MKTIIEEPILVVGITINKTKNDKLSRKSKLLYVVENLSIAYQMIIKDYIKKPSIDISEIKLKLMETKTVLIFDKDKYKSELEAEEYWDFMVIQITKQLKEK
jgi:hypothetical protein